MSRRAQRPELEFGSDSFLDVVCNIVGILIILIVVVGLKVQRQPREQEALAAASIEATRADQAAILAERQRTLDQLNTAEAEAAQAVSTLESQSAEAEEKIRQAMAGSSPIRLKKVPFRIVCRAHCTLMEWRQLRYVKHTQ
jgi:hypothetical protein